jgi:hypothetical protein
MRVKHALQNKIAKGNAMNEKHVSPVQPIYLLKITLGLLVVASLIVAACSLSLFDLSSFMRNVVLGMLLIGAAVIVPFVRHVYLKMDELQKLQHQNACVASLPIIAAVSAMLGILQVNDVIPAFNQFWVFGMVSGVWAINLMLADRSFR